MNKIHVYNSIMDSGIVAIIRESRAEVAESMTAACLEGGIQSIEVTFTVPKAEQLIEKLRGKQQHPAITIGAGTVLDAETARIAILSGAQYIVSPAFDAETARLCNRYQVPYMAGCMTIKEMIQAMEAGVDLIKLFPSNQFDPSFIRSVKGPLPQATLMPTGGIGLEQIEAWVRAGSAAIGAGSELTKSGRQGDYGTIAKLAAQFVNRVRETREQMNGSGEAG
ncbi:bifunctional 2-keto-4-hydroxyglutarate aldolase/2-keto-3-deoxy-6-phosphogluconate aldolase [Marinicrinis sediminis]|uniref:Bifunctional 2-keto-4-hydroxyglutarate aldolase/2-keto-3-deoxy-6-phosphogluconate aldolase n=1 Tax=Marinicrinis sediminis TaxID=1652465 RepID=A0ABW5R7B5_9BACL